MSIANQTHCKVENLFEKEVQYALANIKNGSITVIKQDNQIVQVNISQSLEWNYT